MTKSELIGLLNDPDVVKHLRNVFGYSDVTKQIQKCSVAIADHTHKPSIEAPYTELYVEWDHVPSNINKIIVDHDGSVIVCCQNGEMVRTHGCWSEVGSPVAKKSYGHVKLPQTFDRPELKIMKDTIPWHSISPEYKWAARDSDGRIFVFLRMPLIRCDVWSGWVPRQQINNPLPASVRVDGIIVGTKACDGLEWNCSLQERPGNSE